MNPEMLKPWWWSLPLLSNLPRVSRQSSRAKRNTFKKLIFFKGKMCLQKINTTLFKKMSFLLSCKPLRTIPQQFVAPEENNLISRSYCHKISADYKNLIVRLVTMVPSHNNCNVSSFLSPSPTPTYQAAEKNRFTAKIELLSHSNWKYGTCTGAAGCVEDQFSVGF